MIPSLGLPNKIRDGSFYNLGFALPFLAAFVIINTSAPVELPYLDVQVGKALSAVYHILGVALYYWFVLFFLTMTAYFSQLLVETKWAWLYPGSMFLVFLAAPGGHVAQPNVWWLLGGQAALIMLLQLISGDDSGVSLGLTQLLGAVLSLICLTAGILWYFGDYVFTKQVELTLGLSSIAPHSRTLGAASLLAMGYVLYYGVFHISQSVWPTRRTG